MELDQALFAKFVSFFKKSHARKKAFEFESKGGVFLEEMKTPLGILAKSLTGKSIEITAAEEEGGWRDEVFFLPNSFSSGNDRQENEDFYRFRVAYLAVQKELQFNFFSENVASLLEARQKAELSNHAVLEELFYQYPQLCSVYERLKKSLQKNPHFLWGRWMKSNPAVIENTNLPFRSETLKNEIQTEKVAQPKEEVEILEIDSKSIEDYTLGHNFEKVETLEEFQGNWRDLDGEDHLENHEEALSELDLRQLIRVDQPTHSILRADFLSSGTLTESKEFTSEESYELYDEWDGGKQQYRKKHCKVYPQIPQKTDQSYRVKVLQKFAITFSQMKKQFSKLWSENELLKRQKEGEEIDIDVLVENYANYRAGKNGSENIYLHSQKTYRDLSLIILLDRSLSTDSFTQDQRIIEVEKNSVCLFGEILHELGDSFQIDAFSSRTRNCCDYLHLKTFRDSWLKGQARLGGLDSAAYTRIGPALRHATKILSERKSRQRWVILLSDGKPNDYDRYEGEYGIQDIRQAIREMHTQRVQLYTLAIDSQAKHYLPRMLGLKNFKILPRVELLPQALAEFYYRIKFQSKV